MPSAGILTRGDILNDVGEQPFAFTVRRIRICPRLTEVDRHRDQPMADSFIEDELILLSCVVSIFAGYGQHAELLVPFTFERVSDEMMIRIDQHEATLGGATALFPNVHEAGSVPMACNRCWQNVFVSLTRVVRL